MRGLVPPLIAGVLVATVLGVQVAAGGGTYTPRRPANPCVQRPVPPIPPHLQPLAQEIVLLGLDRAACRLGVSRERLILGLAQTRSVAPRTSAALKAGMLDAVDRLAADHDLPRVSQLLPDALNQSSLPGIVKTLIEAIPHGLVDSTLPTAPLLRRTVDELDIDRLLHQLNDPSQLQSTISSAVTQAALSQILGRLQP